MISQALCAQPGQQPLHRVRMRRPQPATTASARAQRRQQLLRRTRHEIGDLDQRHVPRQHRRRAQPQNRRHRMPDPPTATRIRNPSETLHKARTAATDSRQRRRPADQHHHHSLGTLPHRHLTRHRHATRNHTADNRHETINTQRSSAPNRTFFVETRSSPAPLPHPARHEEHARHDGRTVTSTPRPSTPQPITHSHPR
jgi:hypothetical protein